jgi:hypothetical protein
VPLIAAVDQARELNGGSHRQSGRANVIVSAGCGRPVPTHGGRCHNFGMRRSRTKLLLLECAASGVVGCLIAQFAYRYGFPGILFAGIVLFFVGLLFLLREGDAILLNLVRNVRLGSARSLTRADGFLNSIVDQMARSGRPGPWRYGHSALTDATGNANGGYLSAESWPHR